MGETVSQKAYLIDWLTLRLPLGENLCRKLHEQLRQWLGFLSCVNAEGVEVWRKPHLDIDTLRSDAPGLFWSLQGDGERYFLTIGASPASLTHGLNVWGNLDLHHSAKTLIDTAALAIGEELPDLMHWQCRRIDVTSNYALPDAASVKVALQELMLSSGARRRPSSHRSGGDTVYWNPTSDLSKGKAYHKGPQVLALLKRGKLQTLPDEIDLLDRVLRLEHTRGSRWFRRLAEQGRAWQDLTPEELIQLHTEFFEPLVGQGIEVKNMERMDIVKAIVKANHCTENQALAAFNTYRSIRDSGFESIKESMARPTFYRHMKLLKIAGFTDAHLHKAHVIPFPRVRFTLANPVTCWDDIRRAA